MYKLPWPVPHLFPVCQNFLSDCLSYFLCCEKAPCQRRLTEESIQQGSCSQLQRLSPWLSWQRMWQQTGRHGAEATAESLLPIYKQEAERQKDRKRLGLLAFVSSKSTPVTYLLQASQSFPNKSVYQELNILIQTTTLISFEFYGVLYLYTFPVMYVCMQLRTFP